MDCDRTILVPDATAIVQDQDGNELARENIASGETGIIPVNTGSGVLYTYHYDSFNTGQDVSYATGDDKDIRDTVFAPEIAAQEASGLLLVYPRLSQTDPTKLSWGSNPDGSGTNIFGNLERFTDENGLQVYGNNYYLDHYTGFAFTVISTSKLWETHLSDALAYVLLGKSDYFVPNIKLLNSFANYKIRVNPEYSPINVNISTYSSSTTQYNDSTRYYYLNFLNETRNNAVKLSTTQPSLYFRKAFTYNPTTKQMELS